MYVLVSWKCHFFFWLGLLLSFPSFILALHITSYRAFGCHVWKDRVGTGMQGGGGIVKWENVGEAVGIDWERYLV